MKKKVVLVILSLALVLPLCGCKTRQSQTSSSTASSVELSATEKNESSGESSVESSAEAVPHRSGEDIIGVSDKSLNDDNVKIIFNDSIAYDVTGNWRLARITKDIDIVDYALDYYHTKFKSDSEVHAIVNYTNKTTTKISVMDDLMDVTVHKYVEDEENSARTLFSGKIIESYYIYMDNGDIWRLPHD